MSKMSEYRDALKKMTDAELCAEWERLNDAEDSDKEDKLYWCEKRMVVRFYYNTHGVGDLAI